MPTSKSERLLNLTMALLATKRYLPRNEIFKIIPGYEGNEEARERMFERDKDELRTLGIEIDVGSNDPLFEDELGYRIFPSKYYLELPKLEPEEIQMLKLAHTVFSNSQIFQNLGGLENKMAGLGYQLGVDQETIADFQVVAEEELKKCALILEAINTGKSIILEYWNDPGKIRELHPIKLIHQFNHWYLLALEGPNLDKPKNFRVDRIISEVTITQRTNPAVKEDFPVQKPFHMEIEYLGEGGYSLKQKSIKTKQLAKGISLLIEYGSEEEALYDLLAHAGEVKVIRPDSLRSLFIANMERIAHA